MTDDTNVLCRRCGFANTPGDQFCGSCGAFLEWEGQSLAGEPRPGEVDAAVSMPAPAPTSPPAPAPGPSGAAPAPASAPIPAAGSAELVRCPACGIANPSGRTFCQVCGATLAGAARIQEASRDRIAAAVAATPRPATTQVPTSVPRPVGKDEPARSFGIPRWLIGVALLGVVAGVGFVVLTQVLRPAAPDAGVAVTQAPGAVATPAPGSTAGPSQPGAAATAAPGSSGEPAIVELALTGATASSVILNLDTHAADKAIDGDPATDWQEGSEAEKGEWIEVTFEAARAETLLVRNGSHASKARFEGNRRLRDVLISIDGGDPIKIRLKDNMRQQRIALGGVSGATRIRIKIVNTYAAKRTSLQGSPSDDAALSEIAVLGVPGR